MKKVALSASTILGLVVLKKLISFNVSGKYLLTEQAEVVSENKLKDVGFLVHGSSLVETLCCVAPQEDRYGVVQLVLPEILNTVSATLKAIDQVSVPTDVSTAISNLG